MGLPVFLPSYLLTQTLARNREGYDRQISVSGRNGCLGGLNQRAKKRNLFTPETS